MMRLDGRVALVTGGGRGIGRAAALALAREGARVAVAARTREHLQSTTSEIAASGGEALPLACDVSSKQSVESVVEALVARWGGADIVVNAAGDAVSAPLARTTDDVWERMLAVNLTGTFLMTRAFVPQMVERGWGRVVNIASTAGRVGFPYLSAYCASKHGVVGFTRAVAIEVAAKGVTVNAVCPGYVDSDMTLRSIDNIVRTTGRTPQEARQALLASNPQGRLVAPEEVAHLVLMLCQPESAGINGQAIVLDGGAIQA